MTTKNLPPLIFNLCENKVGGGNLKTPLPLYDICKNKGECGFQWLPSKIRETPFEFSM